MVSKNAGLAIAEGSKALQCVIDALLDKILSRRVNEQRNDIKFGTEVRDANRHLLARSIMVAHCIQWHVGRMPVKSSSLSNLLMLSVCQ